MVTSRDMGYTRRRMLATIDRVVSIAVPMVGVCNAHSCNAVPGLFLRCLFDVPL